MQTSREQLKQAGQLIAKLKVDQETAVRDEGARHMAAAKLQNGFQSYRSRQDAKRIYSAFRQHLDNSDSQLGDVKTQFVLSETQVQKLESRVQELEAEMSEAAQDVAEAKTLVTVSRERERRAIETTRRAEEIAELKEQESSRARVELEREKSNTATRLSSDQAVRDECDTKLRSAQGLVREAEMRLQAVERRSSESVALQVEEAVQRTEESAAATLAQTRSQLQLETQVELEAAVAAAQAESKVAQEAAVARVEAEADKKVERMQRESDRRAHAVETQTTTSTHYHHAAQGHDGEPRWEILLRENTELRVCKAHAESEARALLHELECNNQMYEELQLETSSKDEQIRALQQKMVRRFFALPFVQNRERIWSLVLLVLMMAMCVDIAGGAEKAAACFA